MTTPTICRYCGGKIELVPASVIYGDATVRLGLNGESIYLCLNCNARVGCHKGTNRPLGNVANEVLRLKRMEVHTVFDAFWRAKGMTRTQAYKWLAKQLHIPESKAHIGSFEMDACKQVVALCRKKNKSKEAA